ncbi:hypothetical protein SLA2020_182100 [Shorea laevis]
MGNCVASQLSAKGGSVNWLPSTAKVIHLDGSLLEFPHPVKSSSVLSLNPDCLLCNSEQIYVDSLIPQMPGDEELELGQIYFLIPLSKSQDPISLQDMCTLAAKASAALTRLNVGGSPKKALRFPDESIISPGLTTGAPRCCKVPGFDLIRVNSQGKASNN